MKIGNVQLQFAEYSILFTAFALLCFLLLRYFLLQFCKFCFATLFDFCCCHCSYKWYHEPESLRGLCLHSVDFNLKSTAKLKTKKDQST